MKAPLAPKHLRSETKRWFRTVVTTWTLENHHVRLLTLAAEAWDRCLDAREVLKAEGLIVKNRFGEPRKHPACSIETDARIAFARLLRELDLDVENPSASSRPAPLRSNAVR